MKKRYQLMACLGAALLLGGCGTTTGVSGGSTFSSEALRALEQLTEVKEELKKLRNAVEEVEFDTGNNKRRLQNLFQDLDHRLLNVERNQRLLSLPRPVDLGVTPPAAPVAVEGAGASNLAEIAAGGDTTTNIPTIGTTVTPQPTVSVQEQQAYDAAFNLLKRGKYQDAIAQFKRLADTWPKSQLADDAYYWMSEANYVNHEFQAALQGFQTVVAKYPGSPREPEALLKIGYVQYDIGAYQQAAETFQAILTRFPNHQVAESARVRLLRIERTIQ